MCNQMKRQINSIEIRRVPRLSYAQLFSYQVAYNLIEAQHATHRSTVDINSFKDMLRKGEWNRSILEIDFLNGMIFLQDKDKIVAAEPFADFKKFVLSGEEYEDNIISVRFSNQQWQVMTQNSMEKSTMVHLLMGVSKDLSAEEAILSAPPNLLGLNKSVLHAGSMVRKTNKKHKKDERYLVLVPGKLFLFKTPELVGQHVRYVTSLMGASLKTLQGLEFEILVPGTKSIGFLPSNIGEMIGWIGALEKSVEIAFQLLKGETYMSTHPTSEISKNWSSHEANIPENDPDQNSTPSSVDVENLETVRRRGSSLTSHRANTYGNSRKTSYIQRLGQAAINYANERSRTDHPFRGVQTVQRDIDNYQLEGRCGLQQVGPSKYPPQGRRRSSYNASQGQAGLHGYLPQEQEGLSSYSQQQVEPNNYPPHQQPEFMYYPPRQLVEPTLYRPQVEPNSYFSQELMGQSGFPSQQQRARDPSYYLQNGDYPAQRQSLQANTWNIQGQSYSEGQGPTLAYSPIPNAFAQPRRQSYYTPIGQPPSSMPSANYGQQQVAFQDPYGVQIDPEAPIGLRSLRRATDTLREFNNNMDQYLTSNQASSSGDLQSSIQKPPSGGPNPGMVWDQIQVVASRDDWQEFTSPDGQRYYYNTRTNKTTWERPF